LLPFLLGLQGYIRSKEFSPEAWIIPGLGYDPCGNRKIFCVSPNMYSLGNLSIKSKRIADSVEALIGAYLNAAGEEAAFLFLISLGMDIEFHNEMALERRIVTKCDKFINVKRLETLLGYAFSDPSLLMEALTHGSYQVAGCTACYQVNLKIFEAPPYFICIIFYFQYCFLFNEPKTSDNFFFGIIIVRLHFMGCV
jgi:endoribonuclease Dicer